LFISVFSLADLKNFVISQCSVAEHNFQSKDRQDNALIFLQKFELVDAVGIEPTTTAV